MQILTAEAFTALRGRTIATVEVTEGFWVDLDMSPKIGQQVALTFTDGSTFTFIERGWNARYAMSDFIPGAVPRAFNAITLIEQHPRS